jgi:hypothetical protein
MADCAISAGRDPYIYRAPQSRAPAPHGEAELSADVIRVYIIIFISTPRDNNTEALADNFSASGPTRPDTEVSEAESYARLARAHNYWNLLLSTPGMARRVTKEERSLDSFHNLLFSLTKFYEMMGRWPDHVTIISNEFKRARFLDLHCRAIRWRQERTMFVGIDPEYMAVDLKRAVSVRDGEKRNGFDAWEEDMLGIGEVLKGKRMRRNPWRICQLLFEDEETRKRSGINSRIVEHREILGDGLQPWES